MLLLQWLIIDSLGEASCFCPRSNVASKREGYSDRWATDGVAISRAIQHLSTSLSFSSIYLNKTAANSFLLLFIFQGTGDETILNVAHIPVLSNRECNKYFRGRVRENEMCTSSFQGGVGACEVGETRKCLVSTLYCWFLSEIFLVFIWSCIWIQRLDFRHFGLRRLWNELIHNHSVTGIPLYWPFFGHHYTVQLKGYSNIFLRS